MQNSTYATFHDVNCICTENDGIYELIALKKEDNKKLKCHFKDKNFFFHYTSFTNKNKSAFVEYIRSSAGLGIQLKVKYAIENINNSPISYMQIIGESIDEFFDPTRYFYNLHKENKEEIGNVVYKNKKADEWQINFEEKEIKISLVYGDILKKGIASDLKLHPILQLSFPPTQDYAFLYRLYYVIVHFLQIVLYRRAQTKCQIELYTTIDNDKLSFVGNLTDYAEYYNISLRGAREINYNNYKEYIERLMQFSANNYNFDFKHFPYAMPRFWGKDYSILDYISIFTAFEAECNANETLYCNADDSAVQKIRKDILLKIETLEYSNNDEESFIYLAKERITQLGTQYGQKRKITNAYNVLRNALKSSIGDIFYLHNLENENELSEKELSKFADYLTKTRGTIAHGGLIENFTDEQAQIIMFLEILTYCQILKRANIDDNDIELIIGAIFGCNQILFNKCYNS